jgi:transcriptional regulator with XRE-family HTH domain
MQDLAGLDGLLAHQRRARTLPPPTVRRLLRTRAGISVRQLAAAIGVSPAAVSRWETGLRTPRGAALETYSAALDRLAAER